MPRRILAIILLLVIPAAASAQGPAIGVNASVNANLYNSSYSLANVLPAMGEWRPEGWKDPAYALDARGGLMLPAGEAVTKRVHYGASDYPLGDYTVEWEGDGDLSTAANVPLVGKGKAIYRVDAISPYGIELRCTRSNPADPLRLKAVWAPGYAGSGKIFRDEYVAGLKGYGLLRFVDDQAANRDPPGTWATRPTLSDQSWYRRAPIGEALTDADPRWAYVGLPIEAMAELSNRTGADCWFIVSHLADDDYPRQAAKLFKKLLAPGRKVYVELSNELWNWGFGQSQWQKTRFAPGTDPLAFDANFYGHTDWQAWKSAQIFDAFEAEFSGADRARLVEVIGGQAAWPEIGQFMLLQCRKFRGGRPPCDAYAIAPYFGVPDDLNLGQDDKHPLAAKLPTVEELLAACRRNVGTYSVPQVRMGKSIADAQGVRLVAYECGQGLESHVGPVQALMIAANRDPGMREVYRDYFAALLREGVSEACQYGEQGRHNPGFYWGAKEGPYATLEDSPKILGMNDALATRKLPTIAAVPSPLPPPPPAPIEIPKAIYEVAVDDGSPGYSEQGTWTDWGTGHGGHHRYHMGSDPSPAWARYAFAKVVPGDYQLLATWGAAPHHASRAKYTIKAADKVLATAEADQRPAPAKDWQVVASFAIPADAAGKAATVELAGNSDGDVVADEIKLVCVKESPVVPDPGPVVIPTPEPSLEDQLNLARTKLAVAQADLIDLKAKQAESDRARDAEAAKLRADADAAKKAADAKLAEATKATATATDRAVKAEADAKAKTATLTSAAKAVDEIVKLLKK